jgi:hypothetical protein
MMAGMTSPAELGLFIASISDTSFAFSTWWYGLTHEIEMKKYN